MRSYSTKFVKAGDPITADWANSLSRNFANLNAQRPPNWQNIHEKVPVFGIKKLSPVKDGELRNWKLTIQNCVPSVETRYGYIYYLEPLLYDTDGAELRYKEFDGLETIPIPAASVFPTTYHLTLQAYWKDDGDIKTVAEAGFTEATGQNSKECLFYRLYDDADWFEERNRLNSDNRTVLKIAEIRIKHAKGIEVEAWVTSSPHFKFRPYQPFEPFAWERVSDTSFKCKIWPGYVFEKIPIANTDAVVTHEVVYNGSPISIPADSPQLTLSDGDIVYLKIITDDKGEITEEPSLEIHSSEQESIHYIPPKPDDSSGTEGEFYHKILEFSIESSPYYASPQQVPKVTQYLDDNLQWEPYLWWGDNVGYAKGKFYKGYKETEGKHEFRTLETVVGAISASEGLTEPQLQVNTNGDLVNIGGNGYNQTIVFKLQNGLVGGDGVYGTTLCWFAFRDGLLALFDNTDVTPAPDDAPINYVYFPVPDLTNVRITE